MTRGSPIDRLLEQRANALVTAVPLALGGDVTGVHQARVASRRLREVVPVLGSTAAAARRAALAVRAITRALGPLRELDVSLAVYESLRADVPVGRAADVALRRRLTIHRAAAVTATRRALSAARVARLVSALDRLAAAPHADPAGVRAAVASRVARRAARVRRSLADLGTLYAAERLHAVRIAVKQLRYALEVKGELRGGSTATAIRQLRAAQDLLGRAHDLHVLGEHVRDAEAQQVARSRATARDLQHLAQHIEEDCRRQHAAFCRLRRPLEALVGRLDASARAPRSETAA
jgi:CHAD domain-containing protein